VLSSGVNLKGVRECVRERKREREGEEEGEGEGEGGREREGNGEKKKKVFALSRGKKYRIARPSDIRVGKMRGLLPRILCF
jgi:hypothetical protein